MGERVSKGKGGGDGGRENGANVKNLNMYAVLPLGENTSARRMSKISQRKSLLTWNYMESRGQKRISQVVDTLSSISYAAVIS
jgi:hypothetical protein